MTKKEGIMLVASPGMEEFTKRVYGHLRGRSKAFCYGEMQFKPFACGEFVPEVSESVRRREVYLFHPFHPDPNTSYVKLWQAQDALQNGQAERINLVLPYMPFLRQDRLDAEHRESLTARVMAQHTENCELTKQIITLDMHADQIQGFYRRISTDNLRAGGLILNNYFTQLFEGDFRNVVIVSPDASGMKRAEKFVRRMNTTALLLGKIMDEQDSGLRLAGMHKDRYERNKAKARFYIGPPLQGKTAVLFDDLIDTAGSMGSAVEMVLSQGAADVMIAGTHPLYSEFEGVTAEDRLRALGYPVVVTESIPRSPEHRLQNADWQRVLPLDEVIADAVLESSTIGGSIKSLYKKTYSFPPELLRR